MFFNGVSTTNAYADEFPIVPNRSFKYTDSPNTRGEYAERECARVLDHLFATRSVTEQTRSRIDTHARYGNKRERARRRRAHAERRRDPRILIPHPRPRAHAHSPRASHTNEAGNTHHSRASSPPSIRRRRRRRCSTTSDVVMTASHDHPPARASSTINHTPHAT